MATGRLHSEKFGAVAVRGVIGEMVSERS